MQVSSKGFWAIKNEDFWKEVLIGRTIKSLEWDTNGLSALVLDNDEKVFLVGPAGRICIEDTDDADS